MIFHNDIFGAPSALGALHTVRDTRDGSCGAGWEPTVRIQVGRCVWACSGLCFILFFLFVAAARLVGGDRSYDVVMETEEDKPRYRYWTL